MKKFLWVILLPFLFISGCSRVKTRSTPQDGSLNRNYHPQVSFDVNSALRDSLMKKDYRFMSVIDPQTQKTLVLVDTAKTEIARRGHKRIDDQKTYISGKFRKGNGDDQDALYVAAALYNEGLLAHLKKMKKVK